MEKHLDVDCNSEIIELESFVFVSSPPIFFFFFFTK